MTADLDDSAHVGHGSMLKAYFNDVYIFLINSFCRYLNLKM
jgi:hypothetical protein